jgi:hypothetical protein
MMLLKAALGAFGFLQLKASFVVPKPAIKRTAKTTNIILAYFFEFISPANPPKSPGAGPYYFQSPGQLCVLALGGNGPDR